MLKILFESYKPSKSQLKNIAKLKPSLENDLLPYEVEIINHYQAKIEDLKEKRFDKILYIFRTHKDHDEVQKIIINYKSEEEKIISQCYDSIVKYRNKIKTLLTKENETFDQEYYNSLSIELDILRTKMFIYSYIPSEVVSKEDFYGYMDAISFIKNKIKFQDTISIDSYIDTLKNSIKNEIVNYYKEMMKNPMDVNSISLDIEDIVNRYIKKLSIYLNILNIEVKDEYFDTLQSAKGDIPQGTLSPKNDDEAKIFKDIIFSLNDPKPIFSLGAITPYENYIRDIVQEEIDVYNKTHGMQYNYIRDYEKNYLHHNEKYHETYDERLIESNGKDFESSKYNKMVKLIDYYRKVIVDLNSDNHELLNQISNYSHRYPLLKYNYRLKSIGGISENSIIEAAHIDSENRDLLFEQPTPFIFNIRAKFEKKIMQLKEAYLEQFSEISVDEASVLLNQYKFEEMQIIADFDSIIALYTRELSRNTVNTVDTKKLKIRVYSAFSAEHYFSEEIDIEENAVSDAKSMIASKVSPDYTNFEKILRNQFYFSITKIKELLMSFKLDANLVKSIMENEYELIMSVYEEKVSLYRDIYKKNTQEKQEDIFQLDIFPLYKRDYHSKLNIKDNVQTAIYNAMHNLRSENYFLKLQKEMSSHLLDNYEAYKSLHQYAQFTPFDSTYNEYALKEENIILEYEETLRQYIDYFTKIQTDAQFNETLMSKFNIVDRYFEYYSDESIRRIALYDKYHLDNALKNEPTRFAVKLVEFYKNKIAAFIEKELKGEEYLRINEFDPTSTENQFKQQEFQKMLHANTVKIKSELKVLLQTYCEISLATFNTHKLLEELN